jgi:hypothetical protein
MARQRIPPDIAAAIEECWPDGVVEQFDTSESYFYDIREDLERDLHRLPDVALYWQTEEEQYGSDWDDDDEPPMDRQFESFHMFFLGLRGDEFEFDTWTEGLEVVEEDPYEENVVRHAGKGRHGCLVAVSLASPFAILKFEAFSEFDDGGVGTPDVLSCAFSEETGEPVDAESEHKEILAPKALAKLETLRGRIAKILSKHHITILDGGLLGLKVPELRACEEVFAEPPLTVRDAFFFRGV